MGTHAQAEEGAWWVRRLAFWANPELRALDEVIEQIDRQLPALPVIAGVNSGNRAGFETSGKSEDLDQDLWVELELDQPMAVDRVVLVPLLAKGSSGQVEGFGFPQRFVLEGVDANGDVIPLLDESAKDYPNPGLYPVSAGCPLGTVLQKVRITASQPWQNQGPPVLALAEMLVMNGNRNLTAGAKVRSSGSRESPPTWSRNNLVDMMMPLGLPVAPGQSMIRGWHGRVESAIDREVEVTVDLGREFDIDEIRLVPVGGREMGTNLNYGFPGRFKVETSLDLVFTNPQVVYNRSAATLISPGQNLQCYAFGRHAARYVRVVANRLRDQNGSYVFALGELQAYSGEINVAKDAKVVEGSGLAEGEWHPQGLTDGSAGGGRLIELPEWFDQLELRRSLEKQKAIAKIRRGAVYVEAEHALVGLSLGGVGGTVLMAAVFSWRGHRQRVRDRMLHRERLARDLHDELGSNLGSIALISSFAGHEDAAQMRIDLAEIERVARESADSMRDMVSLLAGKRGGVAAEWLNVMAGLAERVVRGVQLDCQLPTSPLIWEPNLETRRELYLFCKEVLHNAARHGQPTLLKFHLSPTKQGLRIEIADNGRGFDPECISGGYGIDNLRERASMMKAEMQLIASPGMGTSVILNVPHGRRWTRRTAKRS